MLGERCFAPFFRRNFMSRIGKKPIGVPEGVKASIVGQKVEITGPKGSREFVATEDVTLSLIHI